MRTHSFGIRHATSFGQIAVCVLNYSGFMVVLWMAADAPGAAAAPQASTNAKGGDRQ
jgi:hypothetical protein